LLSSYVGVEDRHSDKSWQVAFLQTHSEFEQRFPTIAARIRSQVSTVDQEHWNLFDSNCLLNCRVVEYHRQVAPGPGLPDPKHYDMDSCITVDIVLSVPPPSSLTPSSSSFMLSNDDDVIGNDIVHQGSYDFEGGAFCTLEANGDMVNHSESFQKPGDAVMFVSHKFHCVQKVTKGTRRVLVLEFWKGPTRTCDHRCESLSVVCRRERGFQLSKEQKVVRDTTEKRQDQEQVQLHRAPWLPFRLGAVEDGRLLWQTNMAEEDPMPEVPAKEDLLTMDDTTWDLFGDNSSEEGSDGSVFNT